MGCSSPTMTARFVFSRVFRILLALLMVKPSPFARSFAVMHLLPKHSQKESNLFMVAILSPAVFAKFIICGSSLRKEYFNLPSFPTGPKTVPSMSTTKQLGLLTRFHKCFTSTYFRFVCCMSKSYSDGGLYINFHGYLI